MIIQFSWKWFLGRLSELNWWLISLTIVLGVMGILNVYSATAGTRLLPTIIHFMLGITIMLVIATLPIEWLMRVSIPLYLIGVFLLLLVALFGVSVKGAKRWLDMGFFRFQPSEIMKIAVPMTIAWGLHHMHERSPWVQFPLAIVVLFLPFLLIVKQPDLGTALLVATAGFFVIYLAGLPWKWLLGSLISLAFLAPLYWKHFMHDYQKARIYTLLDPTTDPTGKGYHTIQSIIAIGSGGVLGKGYRAGTQSQLDFLPEPHTDFAFAVLSEEWGFAGFLFLLLIFILLLQQCIAMTHQADSRYGKLLAGSLTFTFFVYIFINIGMVSGILPIVGVPLPFISYGGTAALITFSMMGIILCAGKSTADNNIILRYRR